MESIINLTNKIKYDKLINKLLNNNKFNEYLKDIEFNDFIIYEFKGHIDHLLYLSISKKGNLLYMIPCAIDKNEIYFIRSLIILDNVKYEDDIIKSDLQYIYNLNTDIRTTQRIQLSLNRTNYIVEGKRVIL